MNQTDIAFFLGAVTILLAVALLAMYGAQREKAKKLKEIKSQREEARGITFRLARAVDQLRGGPAFRRGDAWREDKVTVKKLIGAYLVDVTYGAPLPTGIDQKELIHALRLLRHVPDFGHPESLAVIDHASLMRIADNKRDAAIQTESAGQLDEEAP